MKLLISLIFAFFLASLTSAAPSAAAAAAVTDTIECPHSSTVAYNLNAKVEVRANPAKCEKRPAEMGNFLHAQLKQVIGLTRHVGVTELDFRQVCGEKTDDDGNARGNNLRRNRKLQWNWTYSSEGGTYICAPEFRIAYPRNSDAQLSLDFTPYYTECRFCSPEDDDDYRLLLEGEGGTGRHIGGIDEGTITELEDLLSTMLTDEATKKFTEDEESCLFGEKIEIVVQLTDPSPTGCGN